MENNNCRKLTDEARKKMSEAKKGEKNPNFGKPFSDEHRKKISEENKGKKLSDETKRKMSESKKGKKRSEELISDAKNESLILIIKATENIISSSATPTYKIFTST